MPKSAYLQNAILDHVLGGPDFARPATVYLALFNAGLVEVTGGSYARVAVANNPTNFPAAASGAKALATDQVFPTSTADWGNVMSMGIYDAASGGNLLYSQDLVSPQAVPVDRTPIFNSDKITFRESC